VNKTAAFLLTLLLSLLILLNVRQAYLYQEEVALIDDLEIQQQDRYEENRKIRTGIAVLESPERLDALAGEILGLEQARPDQVVQIIKKERGE
jgi:cell division protein FtsL